MLERTLLVRVVSAREMVSLADFSRIIDPRKVTVKRPLERPGKRAGSKAVARGKKKKKTSRWHHMYLLMVRNSRMSSLFDASAP